MSTDNDEICYVKHFSPLRVCFSPCLGIGGEGLRPTGPGHSVLMQFSNLDNSHMEICTTDFVSIPTIQNDEISYVKHPLARLNVLLTLFGCFGVSTSYQKGWGTT